MANGIVLVVNVAAGLAWTFVGFVVFGLLGGSLMAGLAPDDPMRAVLGVVAFAVGFAVAAIGILATFRFTRRFYRSAGHVAAPSAAPPWAAAPAGLHAPATPVAPPLGKGLAGTSAPAATPSAGGRSRRGWLAATFVVAASLSAAGSGLFGTLLVGMDTQGYLVLLTAPVGGFAAGIGAGLLVARRRLGAGGWGAAFAGLAVGVLIGFLSWGLVDLGLFGGAWWGWLAFLAAFTGVPALVGLGVVGLPWAADLLRYWS